LNKQSYSWLILIFFLIGCGGNSDQDSYIYEDTVEIYAVIQYFNDLNVARELLQDKFDVSDYKNQVTFYYSLKNIPPEKWSQFIKDTIDFFIKLDKKTEIRYYDPKGYDESLNQFNDNNLVENPASLPKYWKVYYIASRLPVKYMVLRELCEKGQISLRVFYDENRFKIKEEHLLLPKVIYYESNVPIE
jgi:hypothetical protein